jgi:hypothetical protein
VEAAIAGPPPLLGENPRPLAHVIDPTGSIADCHAHAADQLAPRRPLISCTCRRWATVSRFTAGVTIFLTEDPSARRCPATPSWAGPIFTQVDWHYTAPGKPMQNALLGWLASAAHAANFSPQSGQGAALAVGSAPWPVAPTVQNSNHSQCGWIRVGRERHLAPLGLEIELRGRK